MPLTPEDDDERQGPKAEPCLSPRLSDDDDDVDVELHVLGCRLTY